MRHRRPVAGHHRTEPHAETAQVGNHRRSFPTELVAETDPAEDHAVAGNVNHTHAFGLVAVMLRNRHFHLAHPVCTTDQTGNPVDFRGNTFTRRLLELLGGAKFQPGLRGQLLNGNRRRVVAVTFRRTRDAQKFGRRNLAERIEFDHRQQSVGQRAGFVEDEGGQLRRQFQMADVLNEDAEPRGGGNRGNHRRRRRQPEGAGTGDHHQRNHPAHVTGHPPGDTGEHQHHRRIVARIPVDDPHHRRTARLRLENHILDPAQRGILSDFGNLQIDQTGQVLGTGEDVAAHILLHRQRFAGDRRLVDRALAGDNTSVHRKVFTRPHPDAVPDRQIGHLHLNFLIPFKPPRRIRREFDQLFNRPLRPAGGSGFDDDRQ